MSGGHPLWTGTPQMHRSSSDVLTTAANYDLYEILSRKWLLLLIYLTCLVPGCT